MANFKTHVTVAAVGSGLLSTLCLGAGIIHPSNLILFSVLGTIGGILPDIDLDHAAPTKILFTALGLLSAFFILSQQADNYSIIELWLVGGFSYAVVRYLVWQKFNELTVHRGVFHSIAAMLFFTFLTTAIAYHVFNFSRLGAWIAGGFIAYGFLIHLFLDEYYSVDFMNKRLKRSFGTALKLIDKRSPISSVLMCGSAALVFFITPSATEFTHMLFSGQTYQNIWLSFFPSGTWFNF